MQNYKQIPDKRNLLTFMLGSFFVFFVLLSFFSINNVYGFDSEIIEDNDNDTIDIDTINNVNNSWDNDSNQINLFENDNSDYYDESIQNTSLNETENSEDSNVTIDIIKNSTITSNSNSITSSSNNIISSNNQYSNLFSPSIYINSRLNKQSDYSTNNIYLNDKYHIDVYFNKDYKSDNLHYIINNGNNLEEKEEKSTNLNNSDYMDCNEFYSIFQYYNSNFNNFNNYNGYCSDINDFINHNIVVSIPSNSHGISFEYFNNFIKEINNLNFNKIDDGEDISIIQSFQSSPKPILTILFFIKIFIEHHNNGKEHLSSF